MRRVLIVWLAGAGLACAQLQEAASTSEGEDGADETSTGGESTGTTAGPLVTTATSGSVTTEPEATSEGMETTGSSGAMSNPSDTSSGSEETGSDSTGERPCGGRCPGETPVCFEGACVAPAAPSPGDIVITEFHPDPDAVEDADGEWFELVNVTDLPLDLAGCVLSDAGTDEHTIDAPMLVALPGDHLVLAKGSESRANGGLPRVDYVFDSTFNLANTPDEIVLTCSGTGIDEVEYEPSWPYSTGQSAQLDPEMLDAASNGDRESWCASSASYGDGDLGSPGSANDGC